MKIRADIAALLHAGVPHIHIARQLRVSRETVRAAHRALGLPARPRGGGPAHASLEDAYHAQTRPLDGGHVQWLGYMDGSLPIVFHGRQHTPAPRVAFRLHHGRDPDGRLTRTCGLPGCVAGAHYADRLIRDAHRRADAVYDALFGAQAG